MPRARMRTGQADEGAEGAAPCFICRISPSLGEFDIGGVLYHANYFHLYEKAREELLTSGGAPYGELVAKGVHLPIVESHQHFTLPVHYGVPVEVSLSVKQLGKSSVAFHYEITTKDINKEPRIVHQAWTRHAYVLQQGTEFRVSRIPEKLIEIFEPLVSVENQRCSR